MKIFDTHCHLGLLYQDAVSQIRAIDEARRVGVVAIANVATNLYDFEQSYRNTKNALNVFHTIGLSPSEVLNPMKNWEERIEDVLTWDNVIGVGQIGLDYFHRYGDKNSQIEFFIRQLEIAEKANKPVVLHNREAGNDMLDILMSKTPSSGGILHCFSEDINYAYKIIDLGLYISFAGNLTFRNARNLHEVAKSIPLDRVVIETSSPFLTPHAYRKKRNKPVFIVEILNYLAELRNMDVEELAPIIFENSLKAFKLRTSDLD